jgi:alkanesulfonate monooxygenase SsuD/methylene tetrahydromethanopterin reductase-like flavin-dependent oxidoreductase (luciferase family)
MDLGVCMAAKIDDIDYAVLAEQLGYSHLWVADSQMLWSDCYATMALAATRTERIKIGTGVAVAGTRTSAVTAAAHATINRLAPGRVFCAIGTGNTANRVMGAKPMPIAEFERYIRELRVLLDGEEADVAFRGDTRPVRHLMPDAGFVNFQPRIPLYISGFGPRAMALALRHGDGLVMSIHPTVDGLEHAWRRLDVANGSPVDRSSFFTSTLTTMVVLEPGEAVDSERSREACGAFAIAALHYAFEQWKEAGRPDRHPPFDFWDDYVALLDRTDPAVLHQRIHQGHNCWVVDEEQQFVTKQLIEASCLVGTADELANRLDDLSAAGLDQVMLLPPLAAKEDVLRSVASQVMPRMRSRRAQRGFDFKTT